MKKREVVVTGMAVTTPVGNNSESVFAACLSGSAKFDLLDRDVIPAPSLMRFAGLCSELNLKELPDRKVQKVTTRKDIIGILTALRAAKDAGIGVGVLNPERVAMFTGCSCTQIQDLNPYFALMQQSVRRGQFDAEVFGAKLIGSVNPMVMMQTLMNNVLCYTSIALDIRGVNANFTDFQAAGMQAVGAGLAAIEDGRADVALVGGVSGQPDLFFAKDGVEAAFLADTSGPDVDPKRVIAPYDAGRVGTILSEGSGFLVLEAMDHAVSRGAKIYARLEGVCIAGDAAFYHEVTGPSRGLALAIKQALAVAGANAGSVAVVAHANGSRLGDYVEAVTMQQLFEERLAALPLCSVKPVLGELSEAGGVLNLIVAIEALRAQLLPPTLNHRHSDPQCGLLSVYEQGQPLQVTSMLTTIRSISGISGAALLSIIK